MYAAYAVRFLFCSFGGYGVNTGGYGMFAGPLEAHVARAPRARRVPVPQRPQQGTVTVIDRFYL